MITKEQKLEMTKDRLKRLEGRFQNLKSGGVLRKLRRQIRNAEAEV